MLIMCVIIMLVIAYASNINTNSTTTGHARNTSLMQLLNSAN